ncbi:Proto-oncogene tyrosine-protein kinase ROS [Talaromyces islandicus]|uniref:Proto-oncogene tyrosine-protein kinase ROS n=1 Tax=Talaromyces islandicus TaxID=28573 RepID=A0A0U1LZS9_TALIS|nr:Proto-oncogene tyrosine-protein kinase ROS [Talaromyces islandicus]
MLEIALSDRDEPVRKRPRLQEDRGSLPKINLKSLPLEVRLMIWEHTWPAARVVEAASWEKFDDDEYSEFTIFRPVGSLDTLLRTNFSSRPVETPSPLEKCSFPIALQICQESRMHTLKTYALVQHPDLPECAFYFNPRQDLLWFSCDIASDTKRLMELQDSYQTSINQFRILLVEDTEWEGWDWRASSSPVLSILPALQIVVLIDDDYDDDGTLITHSAEEYQVCATEYQNDNYTFFESMDPGYQLEYMDRGGNSYLGTYIPHRMIDANCTNVGVFQYTILREDVPSLPSRLPKSRAKTTQATLSWSNSTSSHRLTVTWNDITWWVLFLFCFPSFQGHSVRERASRAKMYFMCLTVTCSSHEPIEKDIANITNYIHTKRLEAGLRDTPESLLEATNPAAPLTPPMTDGGRLTSPRKKKRSDKKKPNKKLEPASRSAVDGQRSELESAATSPSAALHDSEVIGMICPPRTATPTVFPASDGRVERMDSDNTGQSTCTSSVTIQPPAPPLQVAGLNLDSAALIMPSLLYKCVKMKSTIGIYGHRTTNIIATNETEKIREYATEISQYEYTEAIRAIKKDKAMYAGKGLQINYTETIYWDIIMKGARLINPATLPVVKGPPDEFTMAEKVSTKKFMCEAGYASGLENQRQYRKLWKSLFEMRKAGIDKILFYRSKEFDKYCKEYPRKSEHTLLDTITSWEKVYGPQIDQLETRVKHLVRGDAKGSSVLSLPHVEEKIKIQPASWNNATNVWFLAEEETAFKLAGGPMVAADDPVWGLFDHQALSESKHNKTLFITLLPKNEHNLAVCPIVPVYPGDFLGIFAGTIRFSDDFNRVQGIHGPMEKLWLDYSNVTGVLNQMKVSKPGGEANVQIRWELVNMEDEGEPRISWTVSVRALKPIKPFEEVVREAPQEEQYLFHQSAAHAGQGFLKAIS